MRKVIFIYLCLCCIGCQAQEKSELLKNLQTLSSDEMNGREFGTESSKKAQEFLIEKFQELNLEPAFSDGYKQPFTLAGKIGNNIVGIIPGNSDQIIVITAHYDHLGKKGDQIYNGADDNASGTAALIELTRHFKKHSPNHTLIIAAVDAEEKGIKGSDYLINHFPLPVDKIVLNINMDMIAHNDQNELVACGTYYYPHLKPILEQVESPVTLKFGHDSPEYKGANNWTTASDHRVFHKQGIPFIYFGVEDHKDYHRPTDSFENINPEFYQNAVALIIKSVEAFDQNLSNP